MEAFYNQLVTGDSLPFRSGLAQRWQVARRQPKAKARAAGRIYRVAAGKRLFDVLLALVGLLVLLPLFALVALLIRLESRGPVFYYSYRVGTGYRIFKFWKFRSMRPDADQLLADMQNLNQYRANQTSQLTDAPAPTTCACGSKCQTPLIDKLGRTVCEKHYRAQRQTSTAPAFTKIVNDPRVTRVGAFLRNTSIDELPQLFNVLRGEMSIIGNRPLPLYEAEKLTTDQFAARFMAPAGITGLWQVSKRGKGGQGGMSEDERKALDVDYARSCSLRLDLQILLRTFPALFQQENV